MIGLWFSASLVWAEGQGAPPAPVPLVMQQECPASAISGTQAAVLGLGAVGGLAVFNGVFNASPLLSAVVGGLMAQWWFASTEEERMRSMHQRVINKFQADHAASSSLLKTRWLGGEPSQ
ncbi:MAG: hypothetical protein WCP34_00575 [Pseudomonadota bacterium]